jgi:hypothetical protein
METSHPLVYQEFKEKNLIQVFEEEMTLEVGNRKAGFSLSSFFAYFNG